MTCPVRSYILVDWSTWRAAKELMSGTGVKETEIRMAPATKRARAHAVSAAGGNKGRHGNCRRGIIARYSSAIYYYISSSIAKCLPLWVMREGVRLRAP